MVQPLVVYTQGKEKSINQKIVLPLQHLSGCQQPDKQREPWIQEKIKHYPCP